MKNKIKIISLFFVLCMITILSVQKSTAQTTVNFQVFYDDLSPYGNWVDDSNYGYVWMPNVPSGFTPYGTNGYWVFTDEGWTWVSNYSWGWAPFHYGRWFYDLNYGWLWAPDNEWGPGWVTWRRSNEYYGWAPISPGISIDLAYSNEYNIPNNRWTFVRNRDFGRTNIHNYYINNSNNVTIINNTTVINNRRIDRSRNVTYNAGPERAEVEKRAGKIFTPVAITESNKPGQHLKNNQLQIYKPRVEKNNNTRQKPTPSKIVNLKDGKFQVQKTEEKPSKKADQTDRQQQLKDQQQKQQQVQQQRNDQQQKQQQVQQQRNDQQQKQQQVQQERKDQQQKQQQTQQKAQQQRNDQQEKKQQLKQRNDQQQTQQRNNQQQKQQPRIDQQQKKQQVQQERNNQQQVKQQRAIQPAKQQNHQNNSGENKKGDNEPY
jgi:hypothetical protein